MQHGALRPLALQPRCGQPVEQVPPPAEVRLHRGDEQALAESARAAEKVVLACSGQPVDERRLVHIGIAAPADVLEALYSDRV